jgi:hypothetical protein
MDVAEGQSCRPCDAKGKGGGVQNVQNTKMYFDFL